MREGREGVVCWIIKWWLRFSKIVKWCRSSTWCRRYNYKLFFFNFSFELTLESKLNALYPNVSRFHLFMCITLNPLLSHLGPRISNLTRKNRASKKYFFSNYTLSQSGFRISTIFQT